MRDFFANTLDLLAGGGAAIAGFLHGMTNGQGRTAILLAALGVFCLLLPWLKAAKAKKAATNGGEAQG
mgnify:CR=1 FL=1